MSENILKQLLSPSHQHQSQIKETLINFNPPTSVLQNKTASFNNKGPKETFNYDIPSALLNNLVDENGEIKEDAEIPQELLQFYQNQYPKTNTKSNKLKSISNNMASYQSVKPQVQAQQSSLLQQKFTLSSNKLTAQKSPRLKLYGLNENIIKQFIQQSSLHSLKELTIDGNNQSPYIFNKIEQPLVNMPNLVSLTLTNHQIDKIENISFLTQLKVLDLSHNKISVIERLESLKNLVRLNLSHNLIESIPYQVFSRLTLLEVLELKSNKIECLSEIKSFISNKRLRNLYLKGNPICKDEEYLESIQQNLYWIDIIDDSQFLNNAYQVQNMKNDLKGDVHQAKRHRSETKTLKQQKKLLSLNFNLEKQVFDQTKKIKKKDQELISALEYVNGLEEELLNIKISSLYNQSAICSPRQLSNFYTSEIDNNQNYIRPLSTQSISQSQDVIFKFPQTSLASQHIGAFNMNNQSAKHHSSSTPRLQTNKKNTVDMITGSLSPCNEEQEQNQQQDQSYRNITKNLNSAFNQTKQLEKSQSVLNCQEKSVVSILGRSSSVNNINVKHLQKDVSIEQLQEYCKKLQQEQSQLQNKQELLKTKIQFKNEATKQYDYQIKDIMVKIMDLNQKVNLQCDSIIAYQQSSSIQSVIEERIKYIKKLLVWRIDSLKQKNKLMTLNQQIQFLTLELNFQKSHTNKQLATSDNILFNQQNDSTTTNTLPHFQSLISQNMITQLQQIIAFIKLKHSKLQSKLHDLDNKIKLHSQFSKQELMDQSIYEFYQGLDITQQAKQILKQNEYELQKCLKKFNKQEKLIEQKQNLLEQINNHDQIQLIKEYKLILQSLQEKQETIKLINDRIKDIQDVDQQEKISILLKKVKNIENQKKKLAQRLIIRRYDSLTNKQEKEEIDKLNSQIETLIQQYPDLSQTDQSKSKTLKSKKSQSPTVKLLQESIITQMIDKSKQLLNIIESLQLKEKQQLLQLRQSQNNMNDLDAYLQSSTIISPSRAQDLGQCQGQDYQQQQQLQTQQNIIGATTNMTNSGNTNNSFIMRTFDNNNPIMTSNTFNQQTLQSQQQQQQIYQDLEYLRQSCSILKQQLAESENERDQLQIDFMNKKEQYESILRNIREQITEKEQKYSQLFKDMQANIQELQKKNNDMIKINSDLIKKVCTLEKEDSMMMTQDSSGMSQNIAKVRRLEWFIQMQSGIVEDLVKQKAILESKCQNNTLKSQHDIERISTTGDMTQRRLTTIDNRTLNTESFGERQFQSSDMRQIQAIFKDTNSSHNFQSRDKLNSQNIHTELTANTENNMIKQFFELFQKNYIMNQDTQGNLNHLPNANYNNFETASQTNSRAYNQTNSVNDNFSQSLNHSKSSKLFTANDMPLQKKGYLTKQQSTNATKDSIKIKNIKASTKSQSRKLSDIHQAVLSPQIIEKGNFQNQNHQNNNHIINYTDIDQSGHQLLDNTNLLANNQEDYSNQNLPQYLQGDGQDNTSDLMMMIPTSALDTAQQSTFNADNQQYSFNNSNILGGSGSGSSGTHANNTLSNNLLNSSRFSLNNNVWTVGVPCSQAQNQQQLQYLTNSNLDLLDTQSQQSLIQTFGKQTHSKNTIARQKSLQSIQQNNKVSAAVSLQGSQYSSIQQSERSSQGNVKRINQNKNNPNMGKNIQNIIKTNKKLK